MTGYEFEVGIDMAMEALLQDAAYSVYTAALEGTNVDAIGIWMTKLKSVKEMKKEMNAAAKAKDYNEAANIAQKIAQSAGELSAKVDALQQSKSSKILADIAIMVAMLIISEAGMAIGKRIGYGVSSNKSGNQIKYKEYNANSKKALKSQLKGEAYIPNFASNEEGLKYFGAAGAALVGGSAGSLASVSAGAVALQKMGFNVDKKKLKKEGGSGPNGEIQPNDKNKLIQAIKKDLQKCQKKYSEKAAQFRQMASSASSETKANEAWDWMTSFMNS